jgi:hypothetical protein
MRPVKWGKEKEKSRGRNKDRSRYDNNANAMQMKKGHAYLKREVGETGTMKVQKKDRHVHNTEKSKPFAMIIFHSQQAKKPLGSRRRIIL